MGLQKFKAQDFVQQFSGLMRRWFVFSEAHWDLWLVARLTKGSSCLAVIRPLTSQIGAKAIKILLPVPWF